MQGMRHRQSFFTFFFMTTIFSRLRVFSPFIYRETAVAPQGFAPDGGKFNRLVLVIKKVQNVITIKGVQKAG
jgi:hypothetical protein